MHLCLHVEYKSSMAKPLNLDDRHQWIIVKYLTKMKTLVCLIRFPKFFPLGHNNYPYSDRLKTKVYGEWPK